MLHKITETNVYKGKEGYLENTQKIQGKEIIQYFVDNKYMKHKGIYMYMYVCVYICVYIYIYIYKTD